MANPTNPFNWQMPTSSDLVTDLPADFEVFGQAVATSMADLLGGTTGQILSKASNTNMDFTWITNDVGDITAVTAGTGITGGGTSGAVTVSFDQANFGGGQFAAGKNKIINGDFNVNQRGFTTTTTGSVYIFDRFRTSTSDGTSTFTAQTFTPGAAPVAGYESTNYLDIASTGQTLTTARTSVEQRIEDVRTLAGQTATISFWAKAASGTPSITPELAQIFGTGGSGSVTAIGATKIPITTSWVRYTVPNVSVPSISGKTIGTNSELRLTFWTSAGSAEATRSASLGIQTATISIWGVQVEAGSATPFQTASGGSPQAELAMCQRYYVRFSPTSSGLPVGNAGGCVTTTIGQAYISLPVTMRISPTSSEVSAVNWYNFGNNTEYNTGTYSLTASTPNFVGLRYTHGSAIFTAGQTGAFVSAGSTSYIAFPAEL